MQLSPVFQKISSFPISISMTFRLTRLFVERARPMIQSWLLLFRFEFIMRIRSSEALRRIVRGQPVSDSQPSSIVTSEALSHAMDLACVFYFKRVRCLQRSAATTILLRRYGWKAEMVTGAQITPFEFHAWTEVDGTVVNDKPYMREMYQVLERC